MRFSILGPLEVRGADGEAVAVGGARLRRLLVLLLLTPGRTVGTDRLVDGIWDGNTPAATGNALQALISRLRRVLGDGAPVLGGTTGYRLDVPPAHVDLCEFEELVRRGRRARADGDLRGAELLFGKALALWRGPALADLAGAGRMEDAALRLAEEQRSVAVDRLALQLDIGSHADALPEIEAFAAREPLDERPVELLMRALAASGRQADALSAYDRLRHALADGLGIDPSAQLQELHLRLLRGELRPTLPAPAPRSAKPPVVRLPPTLTSFIARDSEVYDAVDLVRDTRLATLIGPGGAGKTRLSIETGARFAEQHPSLTEDGVWFVELAPISDGADIPHSVLTALGLRERSVIELRTGASFPGGSVERIIDSLAHQKLLIILDNCEHLITEASRLAERLIAACPGLRILATSREPLAVAGERLLTVPSLALPPEKTPAERVGEYASVRLFTERASAVDPGFTVDGSNVEHVIRICRELDGMPLALELAAARIRALPVHQLADRLADRFRLLTNGSRSALPRHQTLQAVVDWSWELLSEAERTLMRRLSVFVGGATLEAVERVCSENLGGGVDGEDVWPVLFALVDKSLVAADTSGGDTEPRYRMLETVRAYGLQRLAESGEEAAVRRTHAEYLLDLWTEGDAHLRGAEQLTWLARLHAEYDNLSAALRWATDEHDADLALDLNHASLWYRQVVDGWSDISRWSAEILRLVGDRVPDGRAVAYAECLFAVVCSAPIGASSKKELLRAEAVVREIGDAPEDHPSLLFVPLFLAMLGHDTEQIVNRMDAAPRRPDEQWLRAARKSFAGVLEVHNGRARSGRDRLKAGLEMFRGLNDRWGIAQMLGIVSELVRLSDLEAERALLTEGVRVAAELELTLLTAVFKVRRAAACVALGDYGAARRDIEDIREIGMEHEGKALLLMGEADVERASGAPERARAILLRVPESLNGASEVVRGQVEPVWHALLSRVAVQIGDRAGAERHAAAAWHRLGSQQSATQTAHVLEQLAEVVLIEDAVRAATLLGYAEAVRGLPNEADPDIVRIRDRARRSLGEDGFAQAYTAGAGTARDEVVATVGAWVDEWETPA